MKKTGKRQSGRKVREIKLDGFGSNIFLKTAEAGFDPDVTFYRFFPSRPVMAMLASVCNDLLLGMWKLPTDAYGIIAHDFKDYKGLEIVPNSSLKKEERDAFEHFIEMLKDAASESGDISFDPDLRLIVAPSERALLHFLMYFEDCAGAMLASDNEEPDEDETFEEDDDENWQKVAAQCLKEAWAMAALPERSYISREHLLSEIYEMQINRCYDFDRIEAMIERNESTKAGVKPGEADPAERHLIFHLH